MRKFQIKFVGAKQTFLFPKTLPLQDSYKKRVTAKQAMTI